MKSFSEPNIPDISAVTSFSQTEASIEIKGSSGAFAATSPGNLDNVVFGASAPVGGTNSDGNLALDADFNITGLPTAGTKYTLTFFGHITGCGGLTSAAAASIVDVCTREY